MKGLLLSYIREALLDSAPEMEEEEELDEFSGAAAAGGGPALPLGMASKPAPEPFVPPTRLLGKKRNRSKG